MLYDRNYRPNTFEKWLYAIIEDSQNPFLAAVAFDRIEEVRELVSKGADVNANAINHMTPLIIAAGLGHFAIVKILVKAGAELSWQDSDYKTALDYAIQEKYTSIAAYLRRITQKKVKALANWPNGLIELNLAYTASRATKSAQNKTLSHRAIQFFPNALDQNTVNVPNQSGSDELINNGYSY